MSSIYFSSSSSLAETFTNRIAAQCESFLEAECIVPNSSKESSQQKTRGNIEDCDVLIVVICNDPTTDVSAYNLIDNERIRFEIISAMNLDIIIVPVLIDDAKLPEKGNIPGALKKFIDCKSHRLRSVTWSEDMELLLEHLEEELGFLNEVRQKLSESVEVNYQRLADFDGRKTRQDKVDLESSDAMQLRKVIEAETIFLQKARGIGDVNAEKNALSTLGLAYTRLGQTRKAIHYFEEQLKIAQDLDNSEEVCGLLANLGDAYAVSGNIAQAKNFYEEQRLLAESKSLPAYVGSSYNGLGYVYVKQEKIEQAIHCYLKALASYRELEDHEKQLELLVEIGLNYRKLEQWEKTLEFCSQALDAAKYLENRKEEVQLRVDLAETYFKLGKRDCSEAQLKLAEESLKTIQEPWSASLNRRVEQLRTSQKIF
jgi:tetratricopeptide (TPR) repeat protein